MGAAYRLPIQLNKTHQMQKPGIKQQKKYSEQNHMLTPENLVKIHGNNFSIRTAQRRIREVILSNKLNRGYITQGEYCEYFGIEIK